MNVIHYRATAHDPGLGVCLARVAREGFRRRLNAAADPDEVLELVGSDYAVYAFRPAQRALWAELADDWQVRIDAQIEASFATSAAENGAPELASRLMQDAIRRVRAAREVHE